METTKTSETHEKTKQELAIEQAEKIDKEMSAMSRTQQKALRRSKSRRSRTQFFLR